MGANTRSRLSGVANRSEKAERDDKSPRPNSETQATVEQPWGNQAALQAAKLVTEPLQDETGLDLDAERRDDEEKKQNGVQEAGFSARLFSSSPAQKSAPAAAATPSAPQRAEGSRSGTPDTQSASRSQSTRTAAPVTTQPARIDNGASNRATPASSSARSTPSVSNPEHSDRTATRSESASMTRICSC